MRKSDNSVLKFSLLTRENFSPGAAMFTLQNMGALRRKLDRGEDEVILKLIEEMAAAYLIATEHNVPPANYDPPIEQEST